MDLRKLTDEQLRFEFKSVIKNYTYLMMLHDDDDDTKVKAATLKDEYLSKILMELKRRRQGVK